MAELSDTQRHKISQLWQEKQRLDPDMPNRGFSFVKIMEYGADAPHSLIPEDTAAEATPDAPRPSRRGVD